MEKKIMEQHTLYPPNYWTVTEETNPTVMAICGLVSSETKTFKTHTFEN